MPYTDEGVGYRDVDTSLAAANSKKRVPMRERVFNTLTRYPMGMTAQEVAEALGRRHYYGLQPRLSELKNDGRIFDTGIRRHLPTGNLGIVWAVVPQQGRLL